MKRHLQILSSTEAAEIAEAALVIPLTFMLVFGAFWFGRAYNIYATIQQAAQQGALAAARPTSATRGNSPNANVFAVISGVLQADNLSTSQIQLPPATPNCAPATTCVACPSPPIPSPPPSGSCSNTNNIYVCQNMQLNPSTTPVQCGVVVSFRYPFTFNLPLFPANMQNVVLYAQAQARIEN